MLFRPRTQSAAAPPGRQTAMAVAERHVVTGNPIKGPFAEGLKTAIFALGCFWGSERIYWQLPGVYSSAVGYTGGRTPNATYREVCGGMTGHAEAVLVVYDPAQITYEELLRVFWESHDPTQGMRQGNDRGTQYRSAIYCVAAAEGAEQLALATQSQAAYQARLTRAGHGAITTDILPAAPFYYAEDAHQQYLAKNPGGYCGLGGTGVGFAGCG